MNEKQCPLCKSDNNNVSQPDPNPFLKVECKVCGTFLISEVVVKISISKSDLHGKLSAWTRSEYEAGRIAKVTRECFADPPKIFDGLTTESKIILALQTISQKWPVPGAEFELNKNFWPLFCDSGISECGWILQSLADRGFLSGKCAFHSEAGFVAAGPLTAKAWAELEAAKTKHQQHNLCFVAMRFLPELAPLFAAMERACHRAGYECKRVDTDPHADHIDNRLIDMLNRCRFVISDFTEDSRNVYFEAGYARGMGKSVIWTRRATQVVAFDTNQFYFIDWQDSDWAKFEFELETSIGAVVGRLAPLS